MRPLPRKNPPVLAYVLSFGFVALAGEANAACLSGITEGMLPDKSAPPPLGKSAAPARTATSASFVQAVYRPDQASAPQFVRVGDWNGDDEPIVGLWQFVLNGGMDFGTQAWHADGTELMFSAGRNPAQGDVCQGVWRKIGPRTYTLNHIAMGWDMGYGPGIPMVRVHLHAVVKVDRSGKSFSGTVGGVVCMESDLTMPFLESDGNCQQLPSGGSITGTWVQPD